MTVKYSLGFAILLVCFLTEVSSRPSNNESSVHEVEIPNTESKSILDKKDGSIYYQEDTNVNNDTDNTKDIIEKIKNINSFLSKPSREIDMETFTKIQQLIASVKLPPKLSYKDQPQSNSINGDDVRNDYSKSLKIAPNMFMPSPVVPFMSYPYAMNVPVVPSPSYNQMIGLYAMNNNNNNNNIKPMSNEVFQSRQQQPLFPGFPSLPSFPNFSFENFQFQPFAQLFPVLIKNPFVAFSQGGGWDNLIEYGQSADVCSRKQKSSTDKSNENEITNLKDNNDIDSSSSNAETSNDNLVKMVKRSSRKSRALKKRTISTKAPEQDIEENKTSRKIYASESSPTRKTTKRPSTNEESDDLKYSVSEGDSRLPFGDFGWFWNKKPTMSPPGFFINRLKVRKGGVAIAGAGGVATAGNGGTAIVGPGGLAYTKPGGLAIAGPHARVVALSPYTDPLSLISRLHRHGYDGRSLEAIREGKLVATGPVIYYHPIEETSTHPLT